MKHLLVLLGLVALLGFAFFMHHEKKTGINDNTIEEFKTWKTKFGKKYADPDFEAHAVQVFAENMKKIQGKSTMGQTQFMDLTSAEFAAKYLGYKGKKMFGGNLHKASGKAPASIDWNAKGDVQKVKDQGQCGSCWAFSTVGSLESVDAIKGTGLGDFSEQQLVDCSGSYGNMGCNGGLMDYGFEYVIDHGITTESAYPYKAVDQSCKTDGGDFKISKYTDVGQGNCDDLADAIQGQPISVAVDAESWQFYSGGIFSDCGTQLDHGVLLVAYSSDAWTIKNSWGTSWGEKGFIRLAPGNTCGLCNSASYPTI